MQYHAYKERVLGIEPEAGHLCARIYPCVKMPRARREAWSLGAMASLDETFELNSLREFAYTLGRFCYVLANTIAWIKPTNC
jgi:hypothetical protein